jgi:hypothetical protein
MSRKKAINYLPNKSVVPMGLAYNICRISPIGTTDLLATGFNPLEL